MLVCNGVRLNSNPGRSLAAPLANVIVRSNWNESGALRNIYTSAGASKKDGIPSGTRYPQAWMLPTLPGAMSSRFLVNGLSVMTAAIAGGRNGSAALDGVGVVSSADAMLLGFLTAAVSGYGDASSALSALGQALADLDGTGELSPDLTSVLNAVADLAGSSDMTGEAIATLAALAALTGAGEVASYLVGAIVADAALAGGGIVTTAGLTAITRAVATLTGIGALPPAVLNALGLAVATLEGSGDADGVPVAKGAMGAVISLAAQAETLSPDTVAAAVKASLVDTTTATDLIRKLLQNRTHTDPDTGVMTVFDDDDVTPLLTATLWQDVAAAERYAPTSTRIDRRDRLT